MVPCALGAVALVGRKLVAPTGLLAPGVGSLPPPRAIKVTSVTGGKLATPAAAATGQAATSSGDARMAMASAPGPRTCAEAARLALASCGASTTAGSRYFAILTACGWIVSTFQHLPMRRPTAALREIRWAAYGQPAVLVIASLFITIVGMTDFADTLEEAYVPNVVKLFDGSFGGVALRAALTPQKRGLPPPRTGRGRRLPFWTAAQGRPTLPLVLPISLYKEFINALWKTLET